MVAVEAAPTIAAAAFLPEAAAVDGEHFHSKRVTLWISLINNKKKINYLKKNDLLLLENKEMQFEMV